MEMEVLFSTNRSEFMMVLCRLMLLFMCFGLGLNAGQLQAAEGVEAFLAQCYSGTAEDVERSIKAGADVNAAANGYTPLMTAILGGVDSLKKVEMLLAAKADPNIRGRSKFTALYYAMLDSNNFDIIKLLIKAGADVNGGDPSNGRMPLMDACINSSLWPSPDHAQLLEYLLEWGADVHQKIKSGDTALMRCSLKADAPSLKVLISAGAQVDSIAKDKSTALTFAANYNSYPESIITLLDHGAGASESELDKARKSALENRSLGAVRIREILKSPERRHLWEISKPPSIDDFILLCYLGTIKEIKKAIDAGADVNGLSELNYTPLSAAISRKMGAFDTVDLLLKAGANPNLKNKAGETALHLAVLNNNDLEIVRRLLDAKAMVNAQDEDGDTPLLLAAFNNAPGLLVSANRGIWPPKQHARLLKLILDRGADPLYRPKKSKTTPLIKSAGNVWPESLKLLLEAGVDVNAATSTGVTALMIAVRANPNPDSIRLFLDHGANPHHTCKEEGCDILSQAQANDGFASKTIVSLLRDASKVETRSNSNILLSIIMLMVILLGFYFFFKRKAKRLN